jgi:hypothetical protein
MKTIGICAPSISAGLTATFDALGEALGVSFEPRALTDHHGIDGWVVLAADRGLAEEVGRAGRPCYVVVDRSAPASHSTSSTLRFADRVELDPVLRGREITADDAVEVTTLPPWLTAAVALAFKDDLPVWAVRASTQFVAFSPPELDRGEALFTHFSGARFVRLLPLVLFVRALVEEPSWEPPPLQATFMFDDPNLHWTSYGFVDYSMMVAQAAAREYHVAFATIPLDSWFVHAPAGAFFKRHADRVSLLFHGNDHLLRELARSQSADSMQCLLRQAVARISRMEARTGLQVARVMAPPHGACSEVALAEMADLGFEAACVSRGSLRHYNPSARWPRTIGLAPCDVVAGLPVIPRFGLSKHCRNDILIAALLHQPIVPMTHHQAVADGYDLLNETADFVNSLGAVIWRDMQTISRSLYSRRLEGATLSVRMLSRKISVPVPLGATRIQVIGPRLGESAADVLRWRSMTDDTRGTVAAPDELTDVRGGDTLEITSGIAAATRVETAPTARPRLGPVARRILTEVRDRTMPSIHRIARVGRSDRVA